MTGTIIVVASGPSLTLEQCRVAEQSGHPILAVGNTYGMVPGAEWSYACDCAWWKEHYAKNPIEKKLTLSQSAAKKFGITLLKFDPVETRLYASSANSGSQGLLLAARFGAKRIIMIGFDFQHTGGMRHYFGDHPATLRNAPGTSTWLARLPKVVEVIHTRHRAHLINCTLQTAIPAELIPRATLGDVL